jgi:hypothetical protein
MKRIKLPSCELLFFYVAFEIPVVVVRILTCKNVDLETFSDLYIFRPPDYEMVVV